MTSSAPVLPPSIRNSNIVLCDHSRYIQRVRRRYGELLPLLAPGLPTRTALLSTLQALQQQHELGASLRILRHLTLERLAQLDCEQGAQLLDITGAVSELAGVTLDAACQLALSELDALHGAPLKADGQRVAFWILGMGKLGARELNVSSDIDLIYVYEEDGETAGNAQGRMALSHAEFFARVVKRIYQLIGDVTEHGFVFRVDLALRPNGNSGPVAISLGALEEYFLVQGREWERFAWLKSRVVAPMWSLPAAAQWLRPVVLPFVFRRYLDYNVFESLRRLHVQIREHAASRCAGRPERANDVKLSRGGIREIEFTVQLLQVVRGGQFPELRTKSTLEALQRLSQAGLMAPDTAESLTQAYVFLRQVEHRIQYLDDQQTHTLPTQDSDLEWIAQSMGFANSSDFMHAMCVHREKVANEFDTLLGAEAPCKGCQPTHGETETLEHVIQDLPSGEVRERAMQLMESPRVASLRDEARQRLIRLMQRMASWLEEERVDEVAVLRMIDWMEPLLRRESYLALLQERPSVHTRLLKLMGAAKWPARYLMRHPGVIDELASVQLFEERFQADVFVRELQARKRALKSTGEDDEESLMNLIRRAHHTEVFRTLARDIEGVISVEQVADELSALADAILAVSIQWCWERLKQKLPHEPRMAIIGYGKLGGKELGYGSDLDIVFIYDDDHELAQEAYTALVRKLITWLTIKTSEGDVYEIDTALRPNGGSGLLVTHMRSFIDYQTQRGSNTAWTWEHQAITRARCVVGPADLFEQFESVRQQVMSAQRDPHSLKTEILSMREKVRQAHPVRGEWFDVKHSPGGMVDIEFVVQYLLLLHTGQHPELLANVGNIALLQRAETLGLLHAPLGSDAANAYRALRHLQHRARLDEAHGQTDLTLIEPWRDAGLRLWKAVMQA